MSLKPTMVDSSSANLASVALSHAITIGASPEIGRFFELLNVFLHASTNITETVTVTLKSKLDTTNRIYELDSASLSTADDYVFTPAKPIPMLKDDILTVACTNGGGTGTVYSEVRYREAV